MQAVDAKLSEKLVSNAAIIACLCGFCLGCFGASYNRYKIRQAYLIPGNFFLDYCLYCCCGVCAVTQEWMNVMNKEHSNAKITICSIPSKK